jgi:hydrogenase expression/formation protein HypC
VTREICLAYVPEAAHGDYALVHAGFALHLISPEEAQETLDLLRDMELMAMEPEADEIPD